MQILSVLALILGGSLCFGHAPERVNPVAAEARAEQLRKESAERIVAQRKALAALHTRAEALSKSNALRLMMILPTRIPPATLKYFIESHPTMPTAHVFVPLMALAELELEIAGKYGVGVGLVQTELDYLLALAYLGLDKKPKVIEIRQVTARFKPVLGGGFAEGLIRALAALKAESPDAEVVLPPLFQHLAGHLVRGMKMARRLTRYEAEATEVQHWLDTPPLRVAEPRPDRSLEDVGHSETPVPLSQISREFSAASCAVPLVETEGDVPTQTSLQSFTDR